METEGFSEKAKKGPNKLGIKNLGFRESLLESSKVSFFEGFGPKSPKKRLVGFLKVVIYIYIYIYSAAFETLLCPGRPPGLNRLPCPLRDPWGSIGGP